MHVGFVVANYPPHSGGVEKHVAALAQELDGAGVEVTVFNTEAVGERVESGIPVVGLGRHAAVGDIAAFPHPKVASALPRRMTELGITVVSVHTRFFPATWLGVAAASRAGLPSVLTEHGSDHVRALSAPVRGAARVIDETTGRWVWRRADRVLAVSARVAEFVRQGSGREAVVCGNGIDLERWSPPGRVTDERRVTFVGRLVPEKGWRSFIDLVPTLPSDVAFQIIGDGPDRDALRRVVAEHGITNRVEIVGPASSEVVRDHLRGSVLVNPSTAAEGFQTTLLEGAAAGARVVTFDVGGAAEVKSTGAPVWITDRPNTHALTAAVQDALASTWADAAGLSRYSWERVTEGYLAAFDSAGSGSRTRHRGIRDGSSRWTRFTDAGQ